MTKPSSGYLKKSIMVKHPKMMKMLFKYEISYIRNEMSKPKTIDAKVRNNFTFGASRDSG